MDKRTMMRALLGDREAQERLTEAEVLLPCPWCKSHKIEVDDTFKVSNCYYGICLDCNSSGPSGSNKEEAIREWNHRAPILSAEEMEMLHGKENP